MFWIGIEWGFFLGTLGILEYFHRRQAKKQDPFILPDGFMTEDEFEANIQRGRKLVILDDLVLDVEDFLPRHPGGRWNIEHNIGKDVAKFFYGGYANDGNDIQNRENARSHVHSNFARKAVNGMAIARYCQFKSSSAICRIEPNPEKCS